MIIDARSVPTGTAIETEVCIIGGGAAGITLAREFTNASFRVILLESGGVEPERATQDLYCGSDIGRPYDIFPISRLRYFGAPPTIGAVFGAICRVRLISKCARASRIPAGRSAVISGAVVSACTTGPQTRSLWLCPFQLGIAPSDIPEPFRGPHFVAEFCSKVRLRDLVLNTGPNCAKHRI